MSISTRVSIQWNDDQPSEPTSTIVVTSITKHFVDVRIVEPDKIDWAFCGVVVEQANAVTFTHEIDSRRAKGEHVDEIDCGSFEVDEHGDEIEKGTMCNPTSGLVEPYIEIWHKIPIGSTPVVSVIAAYNDDDNDQIIGKVVRVGDYLQAILLMQGTVSVLRAMHNESSKCWIKQVQIGSHVNCIPMPGEGDPCNGVKWIVLE